MNNLKKKIILIITLYSAPLKDVKYQGNEVIIKHEDDIVASIDQAIKNNACSCWC